MDGRLTTTNVLTICHHTQGYNNIIEYIPYDVVFIPRTYLFYSRNTSLSPAPISTITLSQSIVCIHESISILFVLFF